MTKCVLSEQDGAIILSWLVIIDQIVLLYRVTLTLNTPVLFSFKI